MKEQWKTIRGLEDYAVSDHGRIMRLTNGRSTQPGRILAAYHVAPNRKKVVFLRNNGSASTYCVGRLVAEAFLPKPAGSSVIRFKDGDRGNCHVSNLEWIIPQSVTRTRQISIDNIETALWLSSDSKIEALRKKYVNNVHIRDLAEALYANLPIGEYSEQLSWLRKELSK